MKKRRRDEMSGDAGFKAEAPEVPRLVRASYEENRLALFVGSGLSLSKGVKGGFPTWKEVGPRLVKHGQRSGVIDDATSALYLQLLDNANRSGTLSQLLGALDMVKDSLGNHYRSALTEIFPRKDAKPGPAHEAVRELAVPALFTTNYDKLLDLSEPKERQAYTWCKSTQALADLKGGYAVLFKVHGSVEDEESIVLTRREYDRLCLDASYQRVMAHLLNSHTVLFIGYGMNDPFDLDMVLKSNQAAFKQANQDHFALIQGASPEECRRYLDDFNVHVVSYDNHDHLAPFLRRLGTIRPASALRSQADAPRDSVERWLACQRVAHERLVPFFRSAGDDLLDTVYVELAIEKEPDIGDISVGGVARRGVARAGNVSRQGYASLQELLESASKSETRERWVVLGDPGAGKTTLTRHLVWSLSEPGIAKRARPIPVYVTLSRLAETLRHPFDLAEADLVSSQGAEVGRGFARHLFDLCNQPGKVWLFLDGFDEVRPDSLGFIMERLRVWSKELPRAVICVLSRPVGYQELGRDFLKARVRPLDRGSQQSLLAKWLGEERAKRAMAELAQSPSLMDQARNPLMLTLMAALCREKGQVAPRRVDLYRQAVDMLLERGHHQAKAGVRDKESAHRVLQALSLDLQEGGGQAWTGKALDEALWKVRQREPDLEYRLAKSWGTNDRFLRDLGQNGGIMGPHDGPNEPWRYLHRSFREYLTAEELERQGEKRLLKRVRELGEDEAGQWGETLALTAGLMKAPLAFLKRLRKINPKVALEALRNIEVISLKEALGFLWGTEHTDMKGWDGDYLVSLLRAWQRPLDEAEAVLLAEVKSKRTTEELAYLHYALDRLGRAPDRERFFRACGCLPEPGYPEIRFVPIPAGTFMMGSPEDEEGRRDDERPRHEVSVSPFELAETPVTNRQYISFDPSHQSPGKPDEPVTMVSWWEAYLYAVWLGCRLPTEAEWEYACRAGTTTRYYTGDSEADLARAGWYDNNSGYKAHPVKKKEPNRFGLCDMHGNVEEWVMDDWHESYENAPTDGTAWVDEIRVEGADRVLRGGSWVRYGGRCRSASRRRDDPGYHFRGIGFRLSRGPVELNQAKGGRSPRNR